MVPRCLPSSPVGEAVGYAKHQRFFVRPCFSDARFEIDNGHTERILRKPCVGRKAYLVTGSAQAAEQARRRVHARPALPSRRLRARDYLFDVLQKLDAGWPMRRIAELVPDRWVIQHRQPSPAEHSQ